MTGFVTYALNDIATLVGLAKGGVVLFLLLMSELLQTYLRSRAKREYEAAKKDVANVAEIEEISLAYYRRRQMLGIARMITFLIAVLFAAFLYDFQTFGVLALALSALVIIQKENINSLFAYAFVLSNFHVGDDIRVGDQLGEIVRVSPLQTTLSGKEENGEYSGQKITIPNFRLISENVNVLELKSHTYRRIVIRAVYEHGTYDVDFGEFVKRIRAFLDEFLPKRNLNQVGNFRSFAGMQYRINFDYDDDGRIVVRIAFISRPHDVADRKEQIIEFIERMRSKKETAQRGDGEQKEFEKSAQ